MLSDDTVRLILWLVPILPAIFITERFSRGKEFFKEVEFAAVGFFWWMVIGCLIFGFLDVTGLAKRKDYQQKPKCSPCDPKQIDQKDRLP